MSEKNNKYTPNLRFPEFSGEWEETKLGEITRNEDSKRRPISKIDRAVGEYPYYGANGIQDHVNDYIFDGDYLLVGEDGTVLTKENTPVINWASGKFWVNNHAHVLSQKDDTSLKLISYLLSRVKIDGLVTGIPPKLNQDNLNTISIPLPPSPAEQDKIASCLSAMDDLITAQAEKVEALKEKKTGLMQQLFPQPGETTPRLRFPGFTGEWEEKTLGEVCNTILVGYPFKGNEITDDITGHPILRAYCIGEGFIRHGKDYDKYYPNNSVLLDKYKVKCNDIVISMDGSVGKNIALITDLENNYLLIQRVARLRITNYPVQLIYQQIISQRFKDYAAGEKVGAVIAHISQKQIEAFPILIPKSPSEQKKIADCLSELDDLIASETKQLEALKDHKKGLMQQLFPQPAK